MQFRNPPLAGIQNPDILDGKLTETMDDVEYIMMSYFLKHYLTRILYYLVYHICKEHVLAEDQGSQYFRVQILLLQALV